MAPHRQGSSGFLFAEAIHLMDKEEEKDLRVVHVATPTHRWNQLSLHVQDEDSTNPYLILPVPRSSNHQPSDNVILWVDLKRLLSISNNMKLLQCSQVPKSA